MRFYNNYQRPAFELVGVGFYMIAIASLLATSLCGSVYYLLRLSGEPNPSIRSFQLAGGGKTAVHRRSSTEQQRNEDVSILSKLEDLISNRLCATNLTCKFEKRHLPPFVQSLQDDKIVRLQRLRKSTVLVITFNRRETYYVAPLVHLFYARIFADVYYCGPSLNSTDMQQEIVSYFHEPAFGSYFGQRYLTYQTEQPHIDGFGENNYFCFNLALQRIADTRPGLQVDGIFVLADDAIVSFWNLAFQGDKLFNLGWSYSLPFPKLVYNTETLNACDIAIEQKTCDNPNPWLNWPENYQQQTSNFYHELTKKASSSKVYARCLERISKRAKGTFRVLTGFSDMFYVAKKDFQEAFAMFELASRNKVFQEVAVPTSFACFDPMTTGFIDDSGDNTNSNGEGRRSPWEAYDSSRLLTHPFKLSNIVKAMAGDGEARQSRMLGICLYCMLCQYSKYLSLLALF